MVVENRRKVLWPAKERQRAQGVKDLQRARVQQTRNVLPATVTASTLGTVAAKHLEPVTIVFYISGHGFGHASRSIELLTELAARRPDARLIVRTAVPLWLFRATAPAHVEVMPIETDTGVVQIDSLNVDERETARRAAAFYATFDRRVDAEAAFLDGRTRGGRARRHPAARVRRGGARGRAVGRRSATSPGTGSIAATRRSTPAAPARVVGIIRDAYATATRALRLPLHGGFEPMAAVTTDIPFIARRSTRDPAETRERLGIAGDRPFVLASFSAADLDLPYQRHRRAPNI